MMTSNDGPRSTPRFKEYLGARPLCRDVNGAPFRIGDCVRVLGSKDETFDPAFRGRIGIVKYLEYQCGCGQSYPLDPMIGIEFEDMTIEEFWKEELKSVSVPRKKSYPGGRNR